MKRMTFAVLAGLLFGLSFATPGHAESAWYTDSSAALEAARKADKKILVDLFAEWCGWCKVMDQKVFSTPEFQSYAEQFVLLRVDVEDGGYGTEIQQRFRANSLPTLLLLDPHEALVGSAQGYMETPKLIQRLNMEMRQHDGLMQRVETLLAGTDATAQKALAKELHGRGDGRNAARLFEKVLAGDALAGDERSWARLQMADSYRMAEDFERARTTAGQLKKDLARSGSAPDKLAERVDLLLLFIAGGAHDCPNAAAALAEFEKGYPKSPYLRDARKAYRAATTDTGSQCS
ncbi:MAG: thioredoxin family protein [Thermoanaerobaculia bacterium]